MPHCPLSAPTVDSLIADALARSKSLTEIEEEPRIVVSPYRFNPLGAHIAHQGGAVLARCLDQYTILVFWPNDSKSTVVHACLQPGPWQSSSNARHLGQVSAALRSAEAIDQLAPVLARRVRHVYSEMQRVHDGAQAWQAGDWQAFGQLMNASCQSSINDYESGSEWLIALHEIALELQGVHGNRFSGGGYGGCLFMLVDVNAVDQIAKSLLEHYLDRYPELHGLAHVVISESESTVRIVSPVSIDPKRNHDE